MLLSICIPTKDRVDVLQETLESIYREHIDSNLCEVVISDNSENDETKNLVEQYTAKGMSINYFKSSLTGFINSVTVMKAGQGSFIKLHNNYTKFVPGALKRMIEIIKNNINEKPQILFTDGNLKRFNSVEYDDFDSFIFGSTYWNTWSSAFSIWRDDLGGISTEIDKLNVNFPHTSLLFMNSDKKKFIIVDEKIFDNVVVKNKGGYNIFKLFCVDYMEMLFSIKNDGLIKSRTISHIKKELRNKFIPLWLQMSVFTNNGLTFDNSQYRENICKYFSYYDCFVIGLLTTLRVFYWHVKIIISLVK